MTLVRARQHREASQGCPIWAVHCMWDRRHGHVFTTCFLLGHPTSSAQPPPAGKPEHQLPFLRLFTPSQTALTQWDHWALTTHRTVRIARWLALVWRTPRTADCSLSLERKLSHVAIVFFRTRRRPGTKGACGITRGIRRTRNTTGPRPSEAKGARYANRK